MNYSVEVITKIKHLYGAPPEKNSLSKGYGDVAPSSEFGVPDALLANTSQLLKTPLS